MRCSCHGVVALLLAAVAVQVIAGCRQDTVRGSPRATAGTSVAGDRIEVVDDLGRTVGLARPARRIASLSPSNSEILCAIGCCDRLVLRDRRSDHPPSIARLPATDPFQLSPDHLAGFAPDLVLLSHVDAGRLRALERIGIAAAAFDPRTVQGVQNNILAVGQLCGAQQRAAALVAAMRRRVAAVRAAVQGRPQVRVYVEIDGSDPARPWTAGRGSFVGELVAVAGGRNVVAAGDRAFVQVSGEEILRADPEMILLAVDGQGPRLTQRLRRRPGWQQLAAVVAGRVVSSIDAALLTRPGPRLVEGLEQLAAALHDELHAGAATTTVARER